MCLKAMNEDYQGQRDEKLNNKASRKNDNSALIGFQLLSNMFFVIKGKPCALDCCARNERPYR
jgi:hypothetical protein